MWRNCKSCIRLTSTTQNQLLKILVWEVPSGTSLVKRTLYIPPLSEIIQNCYTSCSWISYFRYPIGSVTVTEPQNVPRTSLFLTYCVSIYYLESGSVSPICIPANLFYYFIYNTAESVLMELNSRVREFRMFLNKMKIGFVLWWRKSSFRMRIA